MEFSVAPKIFWDEVRSAPLIPGFIFGFIFGLMGIPNNGFIYGIISSIVGALFYGAAAYVVFGLLVMPVLAFLNRRNKLTTRNIALVCIFEIIVFCALPAVLLVGRVNGDTYGFYALFIIYPATVILGGGFMLVRNNRVFPTSQVRA